MLRGRKLMRRCCFASADAVSLRHLAPGPILRPQLRSHLRDTRLERQNSGGAATSLVRSVFDKVRRPNVSDQQRTCTIRWALGPDMNDPRKPRALGRSNWAGCSGCDLQRDPVGVGVTGAEQHRYDINVRRFDTSRLPQRVGERFEGCRKLWRVGDRLPPGGGKKRGRGPKKDRARVFSGQPLTSIGSLAR